MEPLSLTALSLWAVVEGQRAEHRRHVGVAERHLFAELVADVTRHAATASSPNALIERTNALGWTLEAHGETWVLSCDRPDGGGLYAFRVGSLPYEVILQAPHPFFDLKTGALVASLFEEHPVRAAFFATTHRRKPGADVAHVPDTRFQAATQGVAEALLDPLVVQIHGFAATSSDHDVIVSPGVTLVSEAIVVKASDSLNALTGWAARTGADEPKLAGRTNVQGRLLDGRARFVHLELAPTVRADLTARSELRGTLLQWIVQLEEQGW